MKKPSRMIRRGERVSIRKVCVDDAEIALSMRSNPHINQFLTPQKGLTLRKQRKYFRMLLHSRNDVIFAIIENETQELIGLMGIHRIDKVNGVASTGAMLRCEYHGQGYGPEAKELVLSYAFRTLRLRKIVSSVYPHNTRSRKYLHKNGYREEGCCKAHIKKGDTYLDQIILALFRDDWEARQV